MEEAQHSEQGSPHAALMANRNHRNECLRLSVEYISLFKVLPCFYRRER